jgi:poly-gamma-glutamate synthesis protein (capsule biosynthesis protein)
MHWGNEGSNRPNPDQKKWSQQLASSGVVDLVIGSHPHLLQPIEKFGDMWVVHSLGNLLSNMPTGDRWAPGTQDGAVVEFTITRDGDAFVVSEPRVHPTWVDRNEGFVIRALGPRLGALDGELAQSWRRTVAVLGDFVVPPGDV